MLPVKKPNYLNGLSLETAFLEVFLLGFPLEYLKLSLK